MLRHSKAQKKSIIRSKRGKTVKESPSSTTSPSVGREKKRSKVSWLELMLRQSSQVLKFLKREMHMLAANCAKGASVLCFLCQRRQTVLGGSGGMLRRKFFEICACQIAGNAPSSPPFCFLLLAERVHVIVVSLS